MIPSRIGARELKDSAFGQDTANRPASLLMTVTHRLPGERYFGGVNAQGGQVGFGWNIDEDKLHFVAIDERFLTPTEALAWEVSKGNADAAGALIDEAMAYWRRDEADRNAMS
jgi:hypothetical protein